MQIWNNKAKKDINEWKEGCSRIIAFVIPCLTFSQATTTCVNNIKSGPFWILACLIQSIVPLLLT